MGRIFLSHSSRDDFAAVAIRDWLESGGWDDVFLDLDPRRGIAAGERWERRLYEAANRCEAVLFLISRSWLASDWCFREYDLAVKLNKHIFGLLIENLPIASLPARISGTWQVVNLATGRDHDTFRPVLPDGVEGQVTFSRGGLRRLKKGLERAGLDPRFFVWPPASDAKRSPYRGLGPLEAEDAGIFFGREAPIIAALDQLRGLADAASPRFMVILGASGSGKSSFLRAGLLPRLERDNRHYLPLPPIRPASTVISGEGGLLRALEIAFQKRSIAHTRAGLRDAIKSGAPAVLSLLTKLTSSAALPEAGDGMAAARPSVVLPIDQGEELFASAGREEASFFLPMLRDLLLATESPLIVLMTIRSDAFDSLQGERMLAEVQPVPFNLPPLPRGAYQLVIEGPAKRLEDSGRPLKIDPALTAALLKDIEDGGAKDALPLLAFTLERLYVEHGSDGDLLLSEYHHLGGIRGSIEAAEARVFTAADDNPAIPRDRAARLALLRRALIPSLAGIDPDTLSPRRLVGRLSDIPDEARPLVELLVSERLLATDLSADNSGQVTVELAHETLLRQWGLLQGWLKEDLAVLSTLEGLRRSARDWASNGRDAAWLVHRGGRLDDAEAVLARADLSARMEEADRDYLRTARAAETARRDRELEEARRYAEAQRKRIEAQKRAIEAQRGTVRRTRIGIAAALVLTTIAAGFGWYAWEKAGESSEQEQIARQQLRQAQIAESRFLAREAERAIANHDIPLALELALAGLPHDNGGGSNFDRPIVSESVSAVSSVILADKPKLVLYHHGRETNSALSFDGTRIVTVSDDGTARIWDTATGATVGAVMQHDGKINSAAFSPDGTRIVTGSHDGTARLWDAMTGAALGALMQHESRVNGAVFSPDGARIVTTSGDGTARLWDAVTGAALGAPMRHWVFGSLKATVTKAAFSPEGKRVLTISIYGDVRLWDSMSGLPLGAPKRFRDGVDSASFSPDGARIVITSSLGGTARLLDVATGAAVGTPMQHEGRVNSVAFSLDGTRIVTASDDKTARLWDAMTGTPIGAPMQHTSGVSSAAFSPDGTRIVTTSLDDSVRLWDVVTKAQLGAPLWHEHVFSAAFLPDGMRMVTQSIVGSVRVWDVEVGAGHGALLRHDGGIISSVFSPDGTLVLTRLLLDTVQVFDVKTGATVSEPIRHDSGVENTIFSPDGTQIVTTDGGSARIWDLRTGLPLGAPMLHGGELVSAVFSPDGTRIVTVSRDGTALLWDAVTNVALRALMSPEAYIQRAVFSPDGTRVATVMADNLVYVWEIATGKVLGEPLRHNNEVNIIAFSPDGRHIFTAAGDGTVRRWDATTGEGVGASLRHDSGGSAVLSPDGMRLVTVGRGTAQVWDLRTGLPSGEPLRHNDSVLSAMFSPDGTRVVTASDDRTAGVWDTVTGARLASFEHDNNVYGAVFSPDGVRIITWTYGGALRVWDAPLPAVILLPLARASQFHLLTEEERQAVYLSPRSAHSLIELSDDAILCEPLGFRPYDQEAKALRVPFEVPRTDDAIAACDQVLKTQPNEPHLRYLLDRALSEAESLSEALPTFQIFAAVGRYATALNNLRIELKNEDSAPSNLEKIHIMLAKAIENKFYIAGRPLGSMYWSGEGGPVDKERALAIWQKAAAMGDPGSHERLGWVAELGRDGSVPDLPKALYHYAVAVKLLETAGEEVEAVAPRYRRASLARILDPYVVASKWQEAMVFEAAH